VRQHIASGSPLEPANGFSRAVRHERQVFVSATAAIRADGHAEPRRQRAGTTLPCHRRRGPERGGRDLRDVVRTRVFLVDSAHGAAVAEAHGEAFGEVRPASGFIVVRGFLDPGWLVEIEADAIIGA
jgi:enamine deaminase RidA (YjgF/YER057c/UK114 family)